MSKKTREEVINSAEFLMLKKVMESALETYIKKNCDYGNSFFSTWKKMDTEGIVGAYSRISDKFNRFEHFILNTRTDPDFNYENINESVCDSLIDIANYSFMTVTALLLDGEWKPEDIDHTKVDLKVKAQAILDGQDIVNSYPSHQIAKPQPTSHNPISQQPIVTSNVEIPRRRTTIGSNDVV